MLDKGEAARRRDRTMHADNIGLYTCTPTVEGVQGRRDEGEGTSEYACPRLMERPPLYSAGLPHSGFPCPASLKLDRSSGNGIFPYFPFTPILDVDLNPFTNPGTKVLNMIERGEFIPVTTLMIPGTAATAAAAAAAAAAAVPFPPPPSHPAPPVPPQPTSHFHHFHHHHQQQQHQHPHPLISVGGKPGDTGKFFNCSIQSTTPSSTASSTSSNSSGKTEVELTTPFTPRSINLCQVM
ncbi:unnamed protein product [Darwinula stevensoni]|uniref:Uncharacterized protein n=1 Tax=Darwinula stevensoni TaxID=69355 RepID=A0A7R8X4M4_9CRUS|nr:unnamed protein product [Darwinula stevensoni]CAG0885752.1 unnamed protein product [Darwinula stevensoni]